MKWPRFCHRLFASALGYFWHQCPDCAKWFGGHELLQQAKQGCWTARNHPGIAGLALLVCPVCQRPNPTDVRGPIPFNLKFALTSGQIAYHNIEDGEVLGLPAFLPGDFLFWRRMRMMATAIMMLMAALALFGYAWSPWVNVGLAIPQLLIIVSIRVTPMFPERPWFTICDYLVGFGLMALNVTLAVLKWKGRL